MDFFISSTWRDMVFCQVGTRPSLVIVLSAVLVLMCGHTHTHTHTHTDKRERERERERENHAQTLNASLVTSNTY